MAGVIFGMNRGKIMDTTKGTPIKNKKSVPPDPGIKTKKSSGLLANVIEVAIMIPIANKKENQKTILCFFVSSMAFIVNAEIKKY